MADLSAITTPDGTTYNIKDSTARSELTTKQDALVSGSNIKTINNQSLLGSGNIDIQGGSGSVNDVQMNGASVVTSGTAYITDNSGNMSIDGSLTTGSRITIPNNSRLYSKTTSSAEQMLIGIDNTNLIHIGASATSSNVAIGMYGSNVTLSKAGNLSIDGNITVNNHDSAIGTIELGTNNRTTSVGTTVTTLATIALPAGKWIIQAYVQFPGGSAGYRRAFITDSSTGSGTANYGVSAGYAPSNTIVTQDPMLIPPTLTAASTTYYLRASASVSLTISYRGMKAIRIA